MARKKPSSRENGRRSKGPITQEGKNIAKFNATAHGLAAKELVLIKGEFQHIFDEHLKCYRTRFRPLDSVEEDLVHNLAANRWRFVRLQHIETSFMNQLRAVGQHEDTWQTAFTDPANALAVERLQRYQTRLELNYQRNLRNLAFLREKFPIPEELPIEAAQPQPEQPLGRSDCGSTVPFHDCRGSVSGGSAVGGRT